MAENLDEGKPGYTEYTSKALFVNGFYHSIGAKRNWT